MVSDDKKRLNVAFDKTVLARRDAIAKNTGASKSSLVGMAVTEWLNRNEKTLSK